MRWDDLTEIRAKSEEIFIVNQVLGCWVYLVSKIFFVGFTLFPNLASKPGLTFRLVDLSRLRGSGDLGTRTTTWKNLKPLIKKSIRKVTKIDILDRNKLVTKYSPWISAAGGP